MATTAIEGRMFLAGRWTEGAGGRLTEVRSPATGEVLGAVPVSTREEVDEAARAARDAVDVLDSMTVFDRAKLLHAAAEIMESRKEELGRLLSLEQGKPLHTEGIAEIEESAENFRVAAEDVKRLTTEVLPSEDPNKKMFTFRKPNGVYALITPWNFPFVIPSELLAPGLAGGNACILKPSEYTPLIAIRMVEILEEAGFPAGSVSLLFGEAETGQALVTHPAVDAIGFVGSHETGEAIVRAAGLKRTLMELSGNGPQIVLDDANIEAAASLATFGATYVSGQCCVATERVLVAEAVHDQFLERVLAEARDIVVGDPLDERTTMGPLNNRPVAEKFARHVADARERGVDIPVGGGRVEGQPTDLYYELTVADPVRYRELVVQIGRLTLDPASADWDVDAALPGVGDVAREESFGPVVPITTFSDDEEAIRLANDSHLGLQASVFTSSLKRAFTFIDRLRVGNVVVNDTTDYWEAMEPFGGASGTRTGWGRVGGKYGLMDMTDLRTAVIDFRNTRD